MKTFQVMSFGLLSGCFFMQSAMAGKWISDANGCKAWDSNPVAAESISWNGTCPDGYINGEGVLQWFKDGKLIEKDTGVFKKGYLSGKGRSVFVSGNIYEGDYINSVRNGKGIYVFASGSRYDGDFVNGDFKGKGIYKWKNGNSYEGDFVGNKPNGFGELRVDESAYVEEERSDKGLWTTTIFGYKVFIEQGLFKDGVLVLACTDKSDCENKKFEPYRAAFRNATSSKELSSFIEEYQDDDPDKLVLKARQKIPAAQKREREQEHAAALERAREERAAYRVAFRNASSSSELSDFVSKYSGNDPEKLVPKARQKMISAQKMEREKNEQEQREYAVRQAKKCEHLYVGKAVSFYAGKTPFTARDLYGSGEVRGIGRGYASVYIIEGYNDYKTGSVFEFNCLNIQ